MSANVFPRELGVKLTCNGCGAIAQTAMCGIKRNRDWQSTQGWGKGSDPGSPQRDPQPARKTTYTRNGVEVSRTVPATVGSPGRPSNITHDLCPPCLKLDRAALEVRKTKRAAQIKQRDAKAKERDAMLKHSTAQAEADAR